jgi:hypothetical protein
MITARDKLIVMEDFVVDWKLPKYVNVNDGSESVAGVNVATTPVGIRIGTMMLSASVPYVQSPPSTPWYKRWFGISRTPRPSDDPSKSVEEFFSSIKHSRHELLIVKERAAGYERAILNAKQAGQVALYEQLVAGLNAYKMETHLCAIGLTKYVTEEDVVRFYKQCRRGLRLDWVSHFTRVIPESVTAHKLRADNLGIFDNYVVLHYDPEAKAYAETQLERDARKDPILFGLMRDRRLLYFVGDWIDDHCDLTLDEIADKLGSEAVRTIGSKAPDHPYRDDHSRTR